MMLPELKPTLSNIELIINAAKITEEVVPVTMLINR